MYRRNIQDWSKHFDFIVLDEICLLLCLFGAGFIWLGVSIFSFAPYRSLTFVMFLIDALVMVFFNSMRNVTRRGILSEMIQTFRHSAIVFALGTAYMFILKSGDTYSRGYLIISAALYVILSYLTRLIWKATIKKHGSPMWRRGKMIVVASPESAEGILTRLIENNAICIGFLKETHTRSIYIKVNI